MNSTENPYLFDIRRSSLDDGPGIRTTVFFKGCPLRCVWCHNPESQRAEQEMLANKERCIGCGDCQSVCDAKAAKQGAIDRELCRCCGRCSWPCPTLALKFIGRQYSVAELVAELLKDQVFFRATGGGVTFSGGEPTQYPEYLGRVMALLKRQGVHIALQTCGFFDWDEFEARLLPHLDLIYFDLKIVDPELHRLYTGQDNQQILDNFSALMKIDTVTVTPTIPMVPQITASKENLAQIAELLKQNNSQKYQLRSHHSGGSIKAAALGGENRSGDAISRPSQDEEAEWREYFAACLKSHTH